jgi:hypothetical protein
MLQIHEIEKSVSNILLITMDSILLYNFREYPGFPLKSFCSLRRSTFGNPRVHNTFNLLHMILRDSHRRHIHN